MKNHFLSLKTIILGSVFIVCWCLGALRFQWEFAAILYGILNIPFGVLFLYLDNYLWTNYPSSEFASILIWGITVLCQGWLYYIILKHIKDKWYEKILRKQQTN